MYPFVCGGLISTIVFLFSIAGLYSHKVLPDHNLTKETQDVVKLGIGMLSVLASLVLGLLIATAKTSNDNVDHQLRTYAAEIILLNETLRDYGQEAERAHTLLLEYTSHTVSRIWPETRADISQQALNLAKATGFENVIDDAKSSVLLEHVREAIRGLKPHDGGQKWLQEQALQSNISLLRQRWLLVEQTGPTVRPVVLCILICWISCIFASFGLNAPRNRTVVLSFALCSIAIGLSIFLILEMDSPFAGIMKVSSEPMLNALSHVLSF